MPRASEELTNQRREEIINACASLYETVSFKDITIRDIGERTSFTRTSIYNYFQTKEEIFLALLEREYESWGRDLEDMARSHEHMSADEFADLLSATLENRGTMLKLLSMNLYDMEGNSRMECLVAFKKAYANALGRVSYCLEKFFPYMNEEDKRKFLYAFFPFLFGIYPYTTATEKQREAMDKARIEYPRYSIYEISKSFIAMLLKSFGK